MEQLGAQVVQVRCVGQAEAAGPACLARAARVGGPPGAAAVEGGTSVASVAASTDDDWPAPPDGAVYHGLAGQVVRAVEPGSEADPIAVLVQLLAAFGNAVGRSAHVLVEADRHYTNLFVALVGPSGHGRKGTAWGHVFVLFGLAGGPCAEWLQGCLDQGMSSGEGLIWRVRDEITVREPIRDRNRKVVGYQDVVVDPGVGDKRLFVVETEFASTLKVLRREGNTLSPVLRQAWDRGYLTTLVRNSRAKATNAHVSVIAHITAHELVRHLDMVEMANGFGNRFLWFCVRRSKELPYGGRSDVRALACRLADAVEFGQQVGELGWSNGARELWGRVYSDLTRDRPGLLGAMTARAEAQVVRLAAIYALLDRSEVIDVEHLRAAVALWNYAERSVRYIFGVRTGDRLADEILSALRASPHGLTRTAIRDMFARHARVLDVERALGILRTSGLARVAWVATGGRPAERWYAVEVREGDESDKSLVGCAGPELGNHEGR